MKLTRKRTIVVAVVAAAVAAGGTGAAFATGTLGGQTPQERQAAILQDLAGKLGVSVDKLKTAIQAVAGDQIDQALADGRLTQAQADELKQRLQSSTLLPFGIGPGPGHGFGAHAGLALGRGMELDAAATYLGVSRADLVTELQGGKTLAQVAQDKGKSVDGLKQAMVDAASTELDQAVAAGKITAEQRSAILSGLTARIDAIVDGTMPAPGPGMHRGFGFGPMRGGSHAPGGWH